MRRTSVLLADGCALLREGMAALLAMHPGFDVIGSTGDGRDCVRMALRDQPDVMIFDCALHGLNGIEAARRIAEQNTRTRLVCMSMHEEPHWVRATFDAGAHGYVLKRCAFTELLEAIETVLLLRYYVTRDVAHALVDGCRHRGRPQIVDDAGLSTREREITQLFAEGYSTQAISERLHISAKTVATHREHIMAKLGIHGIAQLTRYALREGLTTLDAGA
jgi:DNA-binding NarL/FixJ family response regulator